MVWLQQSRCGTSAFPSSCFMPLPLQLPVGQQGEWMSLVCCAAAHAFVRAKVRASQPGSGAGSIFLLLSLPCKAGGLTAAALGQPCWDPAPTASQEPCLPRVPIAVFLQIRGQEAPLAITVLCVWGVSALEDWKSLSFFPYWMFLFWKLNLQRKENTDSATGAKSSCQILWYSIYTFKVSPYFAH